MLRKFITKQNLKVKRSRAGLGLFTMEPIKKGEFIIEYTGKMLSKKDADKKGGKYLFEISSRRTIDGSGRGNIARYINHSCCPNCEVIIHGSRLFVFAKRNIKVGEELGYNYGKDYFDEYIKPYGRQCDSCIRKTKKNQTNSRCHLTES